MSSKKNGLGRGFESILPTDFFDESFDVTSEEDKKVSELIELPITEIEPDDDQPRKKFDQEALISLAESIKEHGVLQPIIVIKNNDKYKIVAGERRFRASKIAGLTKIPAIIRTFTDQTKLELSLIENIQRQDLNIIEVATGYLKLRDQFNMSLADISKRVGGKSVSSISNTLRLLKLPQFVILQIVEGNLTEGQARPLVGLDENIVKTILPKIIEENWSARRIENYVSTLIKKSEDTIDKKYVPMMESKTMISNAKTLTHKLGTDVKIKNLKNGDAKIEIKISNIEMFNKIKSLLEKA